MLVYQTSGLPPASSRAGAPWNHSAADPWWVTEWLEREHARERERPCLYHNQWTCGMMIGHCWCIDGRTLRCLWILGHHYIPALCMYVCSSINLRWQVLLALCLCPLRTFKFTFAVKKKISHWTLLLNVLNCHFLHEEWKPRNMQFSLNWKTNPPHSIGWF